MRTTIWETAVIALTTVIVATAFAVRDSSAALPAGMLWGVIAGALFCTFVRLLMMPLQREVEALRDKVAELERRGGQGTS
jgi:hypothetical protein